MGREKCRIRKVSIDIPPGGWFILEATKGGDTVRINEVEALTGITKKNIRFYEEQGLLHPKRNAENGYRDYDVEEVEILCRIRLLRKLGIPIDEIRQMFSGTHTVGDSMRRHIITLEREKRNLEQSMELCRELQNQEIPITALPTKEILERMENMEKSGTSFRNDYEKDVRQRYIAPTVITVLTLVLMSLLGGLFVWAYRVSPENSPPMWVLWLILAVFAAVGVGTVLALMQRIREIRKGEIDDAKYY